MKKIKITAEIFIILSLTGCTIPVPYTGGAKTDEEVAEIVGKQNLGQDISLVSSKKISPNEREVVLHDDNYDFDFTTHVRKIDEIDEGQLGNVHIAFKYKRWQPDHHQWEMAYLCNETAKKYDNCEIVENVEYVSDNYIYTYSVKKTLYSPDEIPQALSEAAEMLKTSVNTVYLICEFDDLENMPPLAMYNSSVEKLDSGDVYKFRFDNYEDEYTEDEITAMNSSEFAEIYKKTRQLPMP